MTVSTFYLGVIDGMSAEELTDFIEDRRALADSLLQDASNLEQEAKVARRTASDHISQLAYARFRLNRSKGE